MWTLYNFWANLIFRPLPTRCSILVLSNIATGLLSPRASMARPRPMPKQVRRVSCSTISFQLQWCFIYPTESFDVNDIVSAKFLSNFTSCAPWHFPHLRVEPSFGRLCASVVNMRVVHFIANKIVSERIARVSCRHRYVGCTMRKLGTWNRMRLENFVPVWIYYHVCVCV